MNNKRKLEQAKKQPRVCGICYCTNYPDCNYENHSCTECTEDSKHRYVNEFGDGIKYSHETDIKCLRCGVLSKLGTEETHEEECVKSEQKDVDESVKLLKSFEKHSLAVEVVNNAKLFLSAAEVECTFDDVFCEKWANELDDRYTKICGQMNIDDKTKNLDNHNMLTKPVYVILQQFEFSVFVFPRMQVWELLNLMLLNTADTAVSASKMLVALRLQYAPEVMKMDRVMSSIPESFVLFMK